jgi:hypothetical protein
MIGLGLHTDNWRPPSMSFEAACDKIAAEHLALNVLKPISASEAIPAARRAGDIMDTYLSGDVASDGRLTFRYLSGGANSAPNAQNKQPEKRGSKPETTGNPSTTERLSVRKTPTKGAAMNPATAKTEPRPSTQFRKAVFGGSLMKHLIFAIVMSVVPPPLFALGNSLPNPAPPFQVANMKRHDPEWKLRSFFREGNNHQQPSFCVGNKRMGVREIAGEFRADRDQMAALIVDNREILRFAFWGVCEGVGFGYPFTLKEGTQPELKVDDAAKTVTYSKEYLLPSGEGAKFSYSLKALDASKVELSWDLGIRQEKLDSLPKNFTGVSLWMFSRENYRNEPILINKRQLKLTDKDKLTSKGQGILEGQGLEFVYAPDTPLQSFSFSLPENYRFSMAEGIRGEKCELTILAGSKARLCRDRLIIDLGVVAEKDAAAPEPVAGIDFWARDAMCVPAPSTRNLMPNPSFEQGLRYWAWWGPGAPVFAPSDVPAYSLSDDALFGKKALLVRPEQGRHPMQSLTVPVRRGKTYTVSFYAKAKKPNSFLNFSILSPVIGSTLSWRDAFGRRHAVSTSWERKSFSFDSDTNAIALMISPTSPVLIDGIQLEEGSQPSEFVAPQIEGVLKTSDLDNGLAVGQPIQAVFELCGKPGVKGEVELTVFNYYREKLHDMKYPFALDKNGSGRIELPFEGGELGTGVFVVKADYRLEGGAVLRDYYRFSIMDFLENKHATKDVFGNLSQMHTSTRGEDIARNYMRWGWGSTTYVASKQEHAELAAKYGITNYLMLVDGNHRSEADRAVIEDATRGWTEVTPEREKQIEDICYEVAKSRPWAKNWAFSTESETRSPILKAGNFQEWAKIQLAAWRGIKRANPAAKVLADGGTSGFARLRGHRETEGYLAATEGKMKWDALATHPYGCLDTAQGTDDLDVQTANLIDMGRRHGYGPETPIDFTEGFNVNDLYLQEWGIAHNATGYDVYNSGRPTYDSGWREFLQSAWAARTYIICLKYWPRVRSFNIWASHPFIDMYLTPISLCKVPNTLGHLLGNPKFKSDIKPSAGVRGYVFEDEQRRGVAAIWCTIDKVEEGLERGPVMQVKFTGSIPTFIDLMGNPRKVESKEGLVVVQLSPAPLFLRSEKGGADSLAAALLQAEAAGAGMAIKLVVQPALDGSLEAFVNNLTNRPLRGNLSVSETKVAFDVAPQKGATYPIRGTLGSSPGKLYSWKQAIGVEFADGKEDKVDWDLAYLYVPHAAAPMPLDPASPQWGGIPAIAMTSRFVKTNPGEAPVKAGYPGDLDAKFQLAWDKDNLYLRISASDDRFVLSDAAKWRDNMLYMHDGCAEVYFDTGANGRSNSVKGFDLDDYRYDFSLGNAEGSSGPGKVYRFAEAFHQLAGGIAMPTKDEAAKNIKCQFQRTKEGYAYVMIFPQRYIEPLHLEKGWRAGFGLFLHDKDDPKHSYPDKGLSLATEPGAACDRRPDLWPIMVLGE